MKDMVTVYDFMGQVTRKRSTRISQPPSTVAPAPKSNVINPIPINGSPSRRQLDRSQSSSKWPHGLVTYFLGVGGSLVSIAYLVLVVVPLMKSNMNLSNPQTLRQPRPIYPETYLENHPYEYAYHFLRPRKRYRRLPLYPPPRVRRWIDPDYSGSESVDDPRKDPWYGELEDIKWTPAHVRHVPFESYAEMLTAEGQPSEDEDAWLLDLSDEDYEHYYAFDDDFVRGRRVSYNGINPDVEDSQPPSACRRTALHRLTFPTCNEVHQLDYSAGRTYRTEFTFINAGTFRDVFGMKHGSDRVAIKEIRYKKVDSDHEMFEYVRMDALVAERMSKYPQAFELYSYCGLTLVSEFFYHGDVERQALWDSSDSSDQPALPDKMLTPEQKLVLCLEMAKGLALLHGNPDGMIIHGDVQMSQFLLNRDKTMLKLNDFNRAEILLWDETHQEYCKHRNGFGHGVWRAPEEYRNDGVTDKVDVFSLANNMLTILTGQEPVLSATELKIKAFRKIVIGGKTGNIPPKYWNAERNKAERALAQMIRKCYAYKPEDRPTIFEVVQELESAVQEVEEERGESRIQIMKSL